MTTWLQEKSTRDVSRNKINSDVVLYYVGIAQLKNIWIMVENYPLCVFASLLLASGLHCLTDCFVFGE